MLDLEAVAAGSVLDAQMWLSPRGAAGVLPTVLDAERIAWRTIELD